LSAKSHKLTVLVSLIAHSEVSGLTGLTHLVQVNISETAKCTQWIISLLLTHLKAWREVLTS